MAKVVITVLLGIMVFNATPFGVALILKCDDKAKPLYPIIVSVISGILAIIIAEIAGFSLDKPLGM